MKSRKLTSTKLLAVVLSVLMIVSIVPVGLFSAYADNTISVSVVDEKDAGISGASVHVDTIVDGSPVEIFTEDIDTNAEGIADLSAALNAYFAANPGKTVQASISASSSGYRMESALDVAITQDSTSLGTITLIKQYTLTVDSNISAAIEIKDSDNYTYASGSSFDADTQLTVTVPKIENYERTAKIGETEISFDENNAYTLELNENTVIDVTYAAIEYKVSVKYDAETGDVTPLEGTEDDPYVTVDRTQSGDIQLTLTPKEHYELKSIMLGSDDVTAAATAGEGDVKYYDIVRADITADTILDITFAHKTYLVTYAVDDDTTGKIEVEGIGEGGKVEAETELDFNFIPETGYSLYKVEVNGENKTADVELKNDGKAVLKLKVLGDTDVKAYFEAIDAQALADIESPSAVLSVTDYTYQGETGSNKAEIYYVLDGNTVKIAASKENLENKLAAAKLKDLSDDIFIYALVGETAQTKNETEKQISSDTTVSAIELRFKATQTVKNELEEDVDIDVIKTIKLPGSIEVIYDNTAPVIDIDGIDFSKYINKKESADFEVTDEGSGVKTVSVSRSYKNVEAQDVSGEDLIDNGDSTYTVSIIPVPDYTGSIEYTITATDYNGNVTSKSFTVNNDSQAPTLAQNITFDIKNVNAFGRALNNMTFGHWFNPYMAVNLKLADTGVEFDTDNAYNEQGETPTAMIELRDQDGNPYGPYTAEINRNGEVTVKIVCEETAEAFQNEVFTGTVFYSICDALGNNSSWQQCTAGDDGNSNFGNKGTGTVMIENDLPTVVLSQEDAVDGISIQQDSKDIYNRDYKSTYTISDENSGIYQFTLKVNNQTIFTKDKITTGNIAAETDYLKVEATGCTGDIVNKIEVTVNTKGLKDTSGTAVKPDKNGAYTVTIEGITDNAGNVAKPIGEDSSVNATKTVYVDRTAPQITKFDFKADYRYKDDSKDTPVAVFDDYGFFFLDNAIVTITAEDKQYKEDDDHKEYVVGVEKMRVYLEDIEGTQYTLGEKDSDGVYSLVIIDGKNVIEPATVKTDSSVKLRIQSKFKGQIYAYAIDELGNDPTNSKVAEDTYKMLDTGYTNPDAAVVENNAKHSDEEHIRISPDKNTVPSERKEYKAATYDAKEYYKGEKGYLALDEKRDTGVDNKVHLYDKTAVYNIVVSDTYSGIRSAQYTVIAPFKSEPVNETWSCSTNYNGKFDAESESVWNIDSKDKNLVTQVSATVKIPYDCNDIQLIVQMTDNSGNESKQMVKLSIDKTAPQITVSATPAKSARNNSFYNTARIFYITVRERNIDPNQELTFAKFNFSKTSLSEKQKKELVRYNIKQFKTDNKVVTVGSGDDRYEYIEYTYQIIVPKTDEGHYTFFAQATDLVASHKTVKADLSKVDPIFTIDSTKPTITIKYTDDQISGANADYFHKRVATITIVEHNFDWGDVKSAPVPSMGGVAPSESRTDNGDTHILTLTYATDGHYSYNISMIDKANNTNSAVNYGGDNTWNKFVVDNTKPIITITGVKDKSFLNVNGDPKAANASINVNIKDEYDNFRDYSITLTRSNVLTNGKTLRKEATEDMTYLLKGKQSGTTSSAVNVPIDIPATGNKLKNYDGIYTLSVKSSDKAANRQDKVITFSVNRFGSVYALSEDLYTVITTQNRYWKYDDLKGKALEVYEINPDKLDSFDVYLSNEDGDIFKPSNSNYKVPHRANDTAWYQYTYRFSIEDFKKDGLYTFYVKSTDGTGKKNDNGAEALSKYVVHDTSFYVDNTKPSLLSVSGIFDKVTYNEVPHTIQFEIANIDTVKEVQILVDGQAVAKWSAEKGIFGEQSGYTLTLEENTGKFTLIIGDEGLLSRSKFEIKAWDFANNEFSTSSEEFAEWIVNSAQLVTSFNPEKYEVTVSENIFKIWWGNQPLFWSTIGGAAAVGLAVFFVIFFKKLKKKEALESEK